MKRAIITLAFVLALSVVSPLGVYADDPPPEAESSDLSEGAVQILTPESESVTVMDGLLSADSLTSTTTGIGGLSTYPISVEERRINGRLVLIKTYEVDAGFNPEYLMEPEFEQNGYLFRHSEILKKELDPIVETKKTYETVTVRTDTDKEADIMAMLAPLLDYSEAGYTGQLELDYSSISSAVEGTKNYSYAVRQSKEFTGLDRNDASYIPKTLAYQGQTLHLADIDWTSMGGAVRGDVIVPSSYTATAYYSGTGYGSSPTGYTHTAVYKGEVSKELPGPVQYFVVYEGFEIPQDTPINPWPWISVVIHLATLTALGLMLWQKYGRKSDDAAAGGGY